MSRSVGANGRERRFGRRIANTDPAVARFSRDFAVVSAKGNDHVSLTPPSTMKANTTMRGEQKASREAQECLLRCMSLLLADVQKSLCRLIERMADRIA